jgi:hypothetical protein
MYGLAETVESLYSPEWSSGTSRATQVLSQPELYAEVCIFIFGSSRSENPVDVLHRQGYFLRGSRDVFTQRGDAVEFLGIVECLMWAYLDRKLPHKEMGRILGRKHLQHTQEAEAVLCRWVNAVVAKHSQLPQLNVIGQQFMGQPYFRIVLFHFTMNDALMSTTDSPKNNAAIAFEASQKLDIPLPFDCSQIAQPPLAILCFLTHAIALLSKLPAVKKRAPVTDSVVARRISGLKELRSEVGQL